MPPSADPHQRKGHGRALLRVRAIALSVPSPPQTMMVRQLAFTQEPEQQSDSTPQMRSRKFVRAMIRRRRAHASSGWTTMLAPDWLARPLERSVSLGLAAGAGHERSARVQWEVLALLERRNIEAMGEGMISKRASVLVGTTTLACALSACSFSVSASTSGKTAASRKSEERRSEKSARGKSQSRVSGEARVRSKAESSSGASKKGKGRIAFSLRKTAEARKSAAEARKVATHKRVDAHLKMKNAAELR